MKTTKYGNLFFIVLFAGLLPVFGELTESEMDHFRSELEIAGVRDDTWKSDDRKEYERLEVNTFQSEDDLVNYDMSRFRIRIVVELVDRQNNYYLVRFTGNAPEDRNSEYTGEDYWNLYMAHDDLEGLDISAYIVQYGIMDDGKFVSFVKEEDHLEDMLERVRKRTTVLFPNRVYLRHHYIYEDGRLGSTETAPVNIRPVKE